MPTSAGVPVHKLDWRAMMTAMLADVCNAISPGTIAMRFHRGLAVAIRMVCERLSGLPVALCGGVFQNRLLVELLEDELRHRQQSVGLPGMIPPNDGGLAAGQLVVALARLHRGALVQSERSRPPAAHSV